VYQSALFHFQALLLVILLFICTCTYVRAVAPRLVDRNKQGSAPFSSVATRKQILLIFFSWPLDFRAFYSNLPELVLFICWLTWLHVHLFRPRWTAIPVCCTSLHSNGSGSTASIMLHITIERKLSDDKETVHVMGGAIPEKSLKCGILYQFWSPSSPYAKF